MMSTSYRTKDLNEAAFIWCQSGSKLIAVEPEMRDGGNGGGDHQGPFDTFYFKFDLEFEDSVLKTLIFDYANEATKVEPQMFVRKQNNLRDRLHAVKKRFRAR